MRNLIILKIVFMLLVGTAFAQTIEPTRQAQIRAALRAHGYQGEMTEALRQVARDHGWQTKIAPDSRVLIFLGLGPKSQHLLNPETALVPTPETVLDAKR